MLHRKIHVFTVVWAVAIVQLLLGKFPRKERKHAIFRKLISKYRVALYP